MKKDKNSKSKKGSSFIPKKSKPSGNKTFKAAKPKKTKSEKDVESLKQYALSAIKKAGSEATVSLFLNEFCQFLTTKEAINLLNDMEFEHLIEINEKEEIKLLSHKKLSRLDEGAEGNLRGIADVTKSGAAYIIIDGLDEDVYVPHKFVMGAMQGDLVAVRLIKSKKNKLEGAITKIIKRGQESYLGTIEVSERFAFFVPDNKSLRKHFFVPIEKIKNAKDKEKVIVRVYDWNENGKNPLAEVVEVVNQDRQTDLEMKSILMQNGFHTEFTQSVINELNKIPDVIPAAEIAKRLDMRDTLTFTIDPIDAKDFDDAISFKKLPNGNFEIGVHIADVSHYLIQGSELDKEAEKRATSVYLPDRVCPMLPERLSNFLCSLRPNEDKLTFSTIFEINPKFEVTHFQIAKTIIHSNKRFTYEEAQETLEAGSGLYYEELQTLNQIAKAMRKKRFEKGAITFEKEEVRFDIDENLKPIGIRVKVRKDAHLLIEDFMLLANETVAKFGSRLKQGKLPYPFVYRVHDKPDETKLNQFSLIAKRFGYSIHFENPRQVAFVLNQLLQKLIGKPEQNLLETLAIRSMAKAEYTTKNIGHFGLAMQHYTHFTSPIRRYPDVMVHRLIFEELQKMPHKLPDDELENACRNASIMERKAMVAEREAVKYYQVLLLEDSVGKSFDGVISGVTARGVFVELIENKCEGMITTMDLGDEDFIFIEEAIQLRGRRSGKVYKMGDAIRVKLKATNLAERKIDLELDI